jgi:hypothetical protein
MGRRERERWDALGLLNFGVFLILVGLLFITNPGLQQRFSDFFLSIRMEEISPNIMLPVPSGNHSILYNALLQFCLIFGAWHFALLGARYFVHDSMKRKTETTSSIVFWFGMALIFYMLLGGMEFRMAYILFIIIVGVSLVISAMAALIGRSMSRNQPRTSPDYIPPVPRQYAIFYGLLPFSFYQSDFPLNLVERFLSSSS